MPLVNYILNEDDITLLRDNNENKCTWRFSELEPILERLRANLEGKQRKKCFFCKSKMSKDNMIEDMEHILHKGYYKQFTYEPKNLILVCRACNFKKGIKDVGIDLEYLKNDIINETYPFHSNNFTIIHPYLDEYENHIEIRDNFLFIGIDNKGFATIEAYKLYRENLVIEKAEKHFSSEDELQAILHNLRNEYNEEDLINIIDNLERKIQTLEFD